MAIKEKERIIDNLYRYLEELQQQSESERKLYPHQVDMLNAIHNFLRLPKNGVIGTHVLAEYQHTSTNRKIDEFFEIVSATGTGKTRAFAKFAEIADEDSLIVTPRRLLNKQAKDEFIDSIGIDPKQVGIFDSGQSNANKQEALNKKFLIITTQALPDALEAGLISADRRKKGFRPVVIVDEVHECAQGPITSEAIRTFFGKSIVAGFTATDDGAHQSVFYKEEPNPDNPNEIWRIGQTPIYEKRIVQAVQEGLLVPEIQAHIAEVKVDEKWRENFQKQSDRQNKKNRPKDGEFYTAEENNWIIERSAMVRAACETHFKYKNKQGQHIYHLPSLFFLPLTKHADRAAKLFNDMAKEEGLGGFRGGKVYAESIHSKKSDQEIEDILERFEAGVTTALITDKFLGIGFDQTSVSVVHHLKQSIKSVGVIQGLGRGTRKQSDDYAKRFGPRLEGASDYEKVLYAFSYVIPNVPGLHPFTFVDVLDGHPEVFDLQREQGRSLTNPPPENRYQIFDNVKITTDVATRRTIADDNRQRRNEMLGRLPDGWLYIKEVAQYTNFTEFQIRKRIKNILPEKKYNRAGIEEGSSALGGEWIPEEYRKELVKGSELVKKGKGNRQIVNISLVEGFLAWEAYKQNQKLETPSEFIERKNQQHQEETGKTLTDDYKKKDISNIQKMAMLVGRINQSHPALTRDQMRDKINEAVEKANLSIANYESMLETSLDFYAPDVQEEGKFASRVTKGAIKPNAIESQRRVSGERRK